MKRKAVSVVMQPAGPGFSVRALARDSFRGRDDVIEILCDVADNGILSTVATYEDGTVRHIAHSGRYTIEWAEDGEGE